MRFDQIPKPFFIAAFIQIMILMLYLQPDSLLKHNSILLQRSPIDSSYTSRSIMLNSYRRKYSVL